MEQDLRVSVSTGAKYWKRLGCWISQCYGPFSFGGRFKTYEPFIYLILQFFPGRSEPRILNQ
jgi:hypothetical protein